jgi:23S rRNA (guanine745-N1)-methyltransferase
VLVAALPFLRCPHCGAALDLVERTVRCEMGHSFDVARQGYVDLTPTGPRPAGDTADMVAARETFLGAGHYAAVAEAVAEEVARGRGEGEPVRGPVAGGRRGPVAGGEEGRPVDGEEQGPMSGGEGGPVASGPGDGGGCVVEIGAGTGYYLGRAAGGRVGIALDSSRYALRRAARGGLAAVGCDAWRALPVRDGVAAAVLCVFAPRNADELRRILAPNGVLIVVTPTPRHLGELVQDLGLVTVDERKPERLARALGEPLRDRTIERRLELSREDVRALVAMGPSARHVDADAVARAATTTLSVRVAVYGR